MKNILLYLCIISTILSSIIYIGVASLYHFFIIFLFVLSLRKAQNNEGIVTSTKKNPILCFTFIWLIYALLSALYSADPGLSMQYTYYILLIYLQSWLFIFHLNDKESIINTVRFFIILATVACVVGMWEYFTGNHLVKTYLDSALRRRLLANIPGFTYRNPNDFSMLLLQLIPYVFYGALFEKQRIFKIISFMTIILLLFVLSLTQSRTILIASLIYSAVVLIKYFQKSWTKIFVGIIVAFVVLQFIPQFNELLKTAFESISRDNLTDSITSADGSGKTRINLFLNCLLMLAGSGGFGVGAGCHRVYMPYYSLNYFPTGHIIVAHNFIAEFLADYGIIMFVALIYFFVASIKKIRFLQKTNIDQRLKDLAFLLVLSILVFPIGAITLSSMIQMTSLWLNIEFIAAYMNVCTKEYALCKDTDDSTITEGETDNAE